MKWKLYHTYIRYRIYTAVSVTEKNRKKIIGNYFRQSTRGRKALAECVRPNHLLQKSN